MYILIRGHTCVLSLQYVSLLLSLLRDKIIIYIVIFPRKNYNKYCYCEYTILHIAFIGVKFNLDDTMIFSIFHFYRIWNIHPTIVSNLLIRCCVKYERKWPLLGLVRLIVF